MEEAFYITPADSQRALGLVCTGYGSKSQKSGACLGRTLNCYGAVWVSQGSGWLETAATRQLFTIGEGTLFWLFPGVAHSYRPHPTGWTEHWVLFEGKLALDFEQAGLLSRTKPVKVLQNSASIAGLFEQIKEDFIKAGPQTPVLSGMLVGRLIAELNSLESHKSGDTKSPTALVGQTIAWLDEHFAAKVDFENLARERGVGYSTLRRYFKRISGQSPQEYLQNLRISRAKRLLVFSDWSIKQIAAATGFNDPYYFSRAFHGEVGLAPSEFRQQQQLGTGGVAEIKGVSED